MRKFFTKKRKIEIGYIFFILLIGGGSFFCLVEGFTYNPAADNKIIELSGTYQGIQESSYSDRYGANWLSINKKVGVYIIKLNEYPYWFDVDNRSKTFRYDQFKLEVKKSDKLKLIVDKWDLKHPRCTIHFPAYDLVTTFDVSSQSQVFLSLDVVRHYFKRERVFFFPMVIFLGYVAFLLIKEYRHCFNKAT